MLDNTIIVSVSYIKKREYYDKININSITDSKLFWKTVCPLFSDKKQWWYKHCGNAKYFFQWFNQNTRYSKEWGHICNPRNEKEALLWVKKKDTSWSKY